MKRMIDSADAVEGYGLAQVLDLPAAQPGPLSGLRLCVKDNIAVAGARFSAGHPLFESRVADTTARSVELLRAAGAHVIGMGVTDSGGLGMTTPSVANPWMPGMTVGGSSGGCAAAIAAGLADIGLGTDTGGSVRVPAACTNIFGFKPTKEAVSTSGVWPLSKSFDHVGLMAGDFDILEAATVVLLRSPTTISSGGRSVRIFVESNLPAYSSPTIRERFNRAVRAIRDAGHIVDFVELPPREAIVECFSTIVQSEAWKVYGDLPRARTARLGEAAKRALSNRPEDEWVARQRETLQEMEEAYRLHLDTYDVFLTPTMLIDPPPRSSHSVVIEGVKKSVLPLFLTGTCFANVFGLPALAMPVGPPSEHFHLHLAARRGNDIELFEIARNLRRALC